MDNKEVTKINDLLLAASRVDKTEVKDILDKARESQGLTLEESAKLLAIEDGDDLEGLFEAAKEVKDHIYGKRVVLFSPLYLSSHCVNDCLYCGFNIANLGLVRKVLNLEEIMDEVKCIESQGHKRLLLVAGESMNHTPLSYVTKAIETIYTYSDIRRVNINAAPMTVEEFKALKDAEIGTYQLFQETYHPETYKTMHPKGPKADYQWRYTAFERAIQAGIGDFGMGALFGLYDYKFEALALINHGNELSERYGIGPHTISVPRLRPAQGAKLDRTPYPLMDWEFKKLVAILRLSVPYTGIILSTRESADLRNELLNLGVSQVSAGSSTSPGGYQQGGTEGSQFTVEDSRTLDEMVRAICQGGYIPSFCTACYRSKRTGDVFLKFAKDGDIKDFCQANALLTLKENLLDFASEATKSIGHQIIQKEREQITNPTLRMVTDEKIFQLEQGKRDVYF